MRYVRALVCACGALVLLGSRSLIARRICDFNNQPFFSFFFFFVFLSFPRRGWGAEEEEGPEEEGVSGERRPEQG